MLWRRHRAWFGAQRCREQFVQSVHRGRQRGNSCLCLRRVVALAGVGHLLFGSKRFCNEP